MPTTLKWTAGLVAVVGLLVAATAAIVRFGDGPLGPFPGGELLGETIEAPVADWSFLASVDRVELQVNHSDPRSITVWVLVHDSKVFIPAAYATRKAWPSEVVADGRVVLRYAQKLYERQAVRIDDPALRRALARAASRKYGSDAGEDPRDDYWYFRLDPR